MAFLLIVGVAKLVAAVVVLVLSVWIAAVAGLAVSGFACSGGVIGEGCSSNNAAGGWMVFGLLVAAGGMLAILALLPRRWRWRLIHSDAPTREPRL
jgi:hypothetical protein